MPPLDSSGVAQFRVVGMEELCTIPAVGNAGVGEATCSEAFGSEADEAVDVDKGRTVEDVAEDCAALSAMA